MTRELMMLTALIVTIFFLNACDGGENETSALLTYPMFLDNNQNNVNDYVERTTHFSSIADITLLNQSDLNAAPVEHDFIDTDNDDICDYAQDGGNTWHGPGFQDENGNGICDYWDKEHSLHGQHEGMRFLDHDQNNINDYFEEPWHLAPNHDFTDMHGDGICDYAQDGGPNWHGPGFFDYNHNGMHDDWESGGRGHGGRHGHM